MLLGELTDSQPLNDRILFRVIGRSLSLQAKCMDSGLRPNLFIQNYALMYYFIRFFKKKTRHHFIGALNAYAYTNEDDTRAFINLRLNVFGVRPYANVDDNNEIIPSEAIRMLADNYDNDSMLKLRYMMYKFVWQNVDDEHHVRQDKLNKEPLAHYLSDLHEDLCG
ncbi:hypothetical protein BD408DRAFT_350734 [Parasitella parasitica]|nr:hypothetical protein BD408DRAFT_350734 [Parasitella parasitica]